jgi:hypothetical protein
MKSSDRTRRLARRVALSLALPLSACVAASSGTSGGGGSNGGGADSGLGGGPGGSAGITGGGPGGSNAGTGGRGSSGAGGTPVVGGGGRTGAGGTASGGASGLGGATINPDAGIRPDLTGRKALFIVSSPSSLDDGDVLIQQLLEIRGMTVTYGTLTTPAAMAAGYNLMILSAGIGSDSAAAVFKDVPIPLVAFGNGVYQTMGFVPNSSSRGSAASDAQAIVTDTSTMLSSDLAMGATIGVTNAALGSSPQYTWGTPGGTAIKVAAVAGMPTQFVVFAYEKGAAMSVGTAAGRRVAIGWKSNAVKLLTVEAFKLQDGAFSWTAGAP